MKKIQYILVFALLLCLLPMPYAYFILVRCFATIIFVIMSYKNYQQKNSMLFLFWMIVAVLFQPIMKIALGRVVWNIIDVIIAVLLLFILWKQKMQSK